MRGVERRMERYKGSGGAEGERVKRGKRELNTGRKEGGGGGIKVSGRAQPSRTEEAFPISQSFTLM